jgi:hypothetical protein
MFLQIVFGDELKTPNIAFLDLVFHNLLNPNLNSKPNPNLNPEPNISGSSLQKDSNCHPQIAQNPKTLNPNLLAHLFHTLLNQRG